MQLVKSYLKTIFKYQSTFLLMLVSAMAVCMSLVRVLYTRHSFFLFMNTNLLLAFIPWLIASFIYVNRIQNKRILLIIIFLWLLFLPNAPYMLTDLIHLGKNRRVPFWYDMIMILTYAFAGLFYFFISLQMMQEIISNVFNPMLSKLLCIFFIYLSGFGIYLGRYLRFYSWDVFNNFFVVCWNVLCILFKPSECIRVMGFTILSGTMLNLVYLLVKHSSVNLAHAA